MEVALGDSQKIDQDKLNEFVQVWTTLDPGAGLCVQARPAFDNENALAAAIEANLTNILSLVTFS